MLWNNKKIAVTNWKEKYLNILFLECLCLYNELNDDSLFRKCFVQKNKIIHRRSVWVSLAVIFNRILVESFQLR